MTSDSRAARRYVAASGMVAVLSVLWYVAWRTVGAGPAAFGFLAMPFGSAACTYAVAFLLRHTGLTPVARRFWRLMLFAFGCMTLGFGMYVLVAFSDTSKLPGVPIPAAAMVATGFLAAGWAVGRVPLGIASRSQRGKQALDRAIALLGVGTLLFHFGLAPMIWAPVPWSAQGTALAVMSSVFAVGGITKVSYIAGGPVDRVAVRLIAAMGVIGAVVAFLESAGGAVFAHAVVLPTAPVVAAYAVYRQLTSSGARPSRANSWLPYLAVLAVDVPLLSLLTGPLTLSGRLVIGSAVVVTALVAVRQFVAIRENGRLLREKRASEERLRHEVTHDGLTGLANRGLFRERLAAALAAGEATVLLVDLDDFKTVNDSLGHEVGDHLLIAAGEALRTAIGDAGLPVRLGGDEFAVLLCPRDGRRVDGDAVAQRVLTAFGEPMSAHHLLVHASIGVATATAGTPLDQVLRDADVAMYAAKQRGKANWVRYHDGMEQPVLAHARLGGELSRALEAGEFRVVYQPIMTLADRRVIGVEALVRWHHPTRGVVSPAEFIPAAEATGLIVPLGRFVLRETCRQAVAWIAEFGPDVLQKVGPNVSVRQLHDPDFVADVRAVLAGEGLPAQRLVLELTESAVLRGPQVVRTLHELHDMGIRLALDDFGTGESSLSLLRAFPAAIIKLDKSFVDGIELDEPGTPAADARQAVARAVIQLAGALGLDSVAEGIESQEQADRLQALGYTVGQGYHLARPMHPDDLTRIFAAQRDLAHAV